jgi:hypothetical protein
MRDAQRQLSIMGVLYQRLYHRAITDVTAQLLGCLEINDMSVEEA